VTAPVYKSPRGERLALGVYQHLLDRWPVPAEQRMVPTREGGTFVLVFGGEANPPLVLLHGSAANSSTWGGEAGTWARHFRVYAVDLPGETGKSTQTRPPYAGATYAEWLADVVDGLGLERASFAGLSLGGWAALKFAAHYPQRVDRVALMAPGGVVRAKLGFMLSAAVYQRLGMWGIRRITRRVFAPHQAPLGAAEGFAFMLKHYRARRDNLPPLSDDELRAVAAPVFFIGGENDALLDMQATHHRLQALLPDFRGRVVPGAGNALLGVAEEVTAWLSANVETPGPVAAPAS
jgi:pimeloyl-ACP methyl ester carboxylesterase